MKPKSKQLLQALIVMALWGSLYPVVKSGYGPFGVSGVGDTMLFAGVRFAICGGLILAWCFVFRRQELQLVKADILLVCLTGLFSVVIHYGLLYFGMTMTTGAKTSMLKQVGVLFYICLSPLFLPEDKVTPRKILGALLGFAGIGVISLDGGALRLGLGDALIVAASFSIMFSNVLSKRILSKGTDPVVITGIAQSVGGVIMVALGLAFGGRMQMVDPSGIGIMGYICTASIVSYLLWYSVLRKGQLSELFIIKFTEVLFSGIVSCLVLGENVFRLEYACAVVLIAGGVWVCNGGKGKKRSRAL